MSQALGACIATGAFLLASLWVVWPAPLHVDWALPSGDSPIGTVPMLNAWIMWWNADRVAHLWSNYWHAPIFYPAKYAFGLSEPQPLAVVVSPIVWLLGPVPAYNAYALVMLTLNGVFTRRLLRYLEVRPWCATAAGTAMVLHPLAIHNLEAIQLIVLWPVLWLLHRLVVFSRTPTLPNGALAGMAWAMTAYACLHHAMVTALPLVASVWFLVPSQPPRRGWNAFFIPMVAGSGIALLLVSPLAYGVWSAAAEHGVTRDIRTVESLSAVLSDWGTLPSTAWFQIEMGGRARFPLCPGWLRLAAAILALALVARGRRREVHFLAAMAGAGFLLSFGANLPWELWQTASGWIPPLQWVRSPYRFAYLTQVCVILLAFCAVEELVRKLAVQATPRSIPSRYVSVLASPLVAIALMMETPPPRTALCFPPSTSSSAGWVDYLSQAADPADVIVCLPVSPDASEAGMETETRWMLYQPQHHLRMLNGYSGFIPEPWSALRKMLRKQPLSEPSLKTLGRYSVRWIVVRRSLETDAWGASPSIRWTYEDARFRVGELVSKRP